MSKVELTKNQENAINFREKSMIVSASAGCGKTFVLTHRICKRVCGSYDGEDIENGQEEDRIDLDKIIVLTFTIEAAKQMKEKIAKVINKKIKENPTDAHIRNQEGLLSSAYICTIDSFCNAVIKDYYEKVGIEPGFSVVDPGYEKNLNHYVFEKLLAELFDKGDKDLETLCAIFSPMGKDLGILENTINDINKKADSMAWPEDYLNKLIDDNKIIKNGNIPKEFQDFIVKYQDILLNGAISFLKSLKVMSLELAPLADTVYIDETVNVIEDLIKLSFDERFGAKFDLGRKISWKTLYPDKAVNDKISKKYNSCKTVIKDALSILPASLDESSDIVARGAILATRLLKLTLLYREALMEYKRKINSYTFSDIEHMVLDVMYNKDEKDENGNPVISDVAKFFRETYEEVYIDEYQDSNDVQEQFLKAISREREGKGNRFMVGDMKQSIYAFRMADPEIFKKKFDDESCQKEDLFKNFRSSDNVIDSVNDIFADIMHEDLGDIEYDENAKLVRGREVPKVHENITEVDIIKDDDYSADKAREREAIFVASRIKELIENHKIFDDKIQDYRNVEFKDIVILSDKRSAIKYFTDIFNKAGIPLITDFKDGYMVATEVNMLLSFLKIIDNPRRDKDIFTVLSSDAVNMSEDDMVYLSKLRGRNEVFYDALRKLVEMNVSAEATIKDEYKDTYKRIQVTVKKFLGDLNTLRDYAYTSTASEVLKEIIRFYNLDDICMTMENGILKKNNIHRLVRMAKDFERNNEGSVHNFVTYMEDAAMLGADWPANTFDDMNAVRYMTIHGSKGLEFPICFVVGTGAENKLKNKDNKMNPDITDLGIVCHAMDVENQVIYRNFLSDISRKYMELDEKGERLRLLYVALTRAKDKLIIVGSLKKYEDFAWYEFRDTLTEYPLYYRLKAKNYLELMYYSILKNPDDFKVNEYSFADVDSMDYLAQNVAETTIFDNINAVKHLDDFVYPHSSLENLYVKTSVTDVKKKAYGDDTDDDKSKKMYNHKDAYVPLFASKKTENKASETGTAFHRIMELLQYDAFYDGETLKSDTRKILEKEVQKYIQKGFIAGDDVLLVDLSKVEEFITADIGKRMAKAYNNHVLKREQPFVLRYEASKLIENIPEGETVLMQGVIDAYFEEDGELVLLDYKTDRVDEEELLKRHKLQLQIYAEALEKLTGKKVKERLIYSFNLGKVINA